MEEVDRPIKALFMHRQRPLRAIHIVELAPNPYIFIICKCLVDVNVFARFDEIPSMTLKDIKETNRYGLKERRKDARTDRQRENSIPTHKHSLLGYNNAMGID